LRLPARPSRASTASAFSAGQHDVLQQTDAAHQIELLEDKTEGPAPHRSQTSLRQARDVAAVDLHVAAGRPAHAADQAEQRRLAGAARPFEHHRLALDHLEGDVDHRLFFVGQATVVYLAEFVRRDQCLHDLSLLPLFNAA